MVHDLLPTKERLYRLIMPDIPTPLCNLCSMEAVDSLEHALIICPFNTSGAFLLTMIQTIIPDVKPNQIVLLQLDVASNQKLLTSYLISSVLSQTWLSRKEKKACNLRSIRANLEAGVQILRKSRHTETAQKIDELLLNIVL